MWDAFSLLAQVGEETGMDTRVLIAVIAVLGLIVLAETFDHNGKVVLVLDQQTSQLLGNKTIDLTADNDGSHLILD